MNIIKWLLMGSGEVIASLNTGVSEYYSIAILLILLYTIVMQVSPNGWYTLHAHESVVVTLLRVHVFIPAWFTLFVHVINHHRICGDCVCTYLYVYSKTSKQRTHCHLSFVER